MIRAKVKTRVLKAESEWPLIWLLTPVTAIAVHAPVAAWGWTLPTIWVLYVITMPLGFFCLFRSLWVLHRLKR